MKQNQCLDIVKQTKSSNTKPDFDSSKDGHSGKTWEWLARDQVFNQVANYSEDQAKTELEGKNSNLDKFFRHIVDGYL